MVHRTGQSAEAVIGHPAVPMLDLQQFCSTDELRPWLARPFRLGDHTYATDGRLLIRIAAREQDCAPKNPPQDWENKVSRYFLPMQEAAFQSPPPVNLPPLEKERIIACSACDGRGKEHDCPDCECECWNCNGSGKEKIEPQVSATFGGATFDLKYIHNVVNLPGLELAIGTVDVDKLEPLLFRFEGGEGALMPLRGEYITHVDISAHGTPPAHG